MKAHTSRSIVEFSVPDVRLVRDDGKAVGLREELDGRRSVVLSFIYTGCTTICPVTSATFAQLQRRLGAGISKVQLVSISIDPDQDTPDRLAAYAKQFRAGPGWRFYTGTAGASVEVQRAFDAYDGDKMRHEPDSYVRRAGSQSWVRLHGFASADELLAECGEVVTSN
jgi:protein SCO1